MVAHSFSNKLTTSKWVSVKYSCQVPPRLAWLCDWNHHLYGASFMSSRVHINTHSHTLWTWPQGWMGGLLTSSLPKITYHTHQPSASIDREVIIYKHIQLIEGFLSKCSYWEWMQGGSMCKNEQESEIDGKKGHGLGVREPWNAPLYWYNWYIYIYIWVCLCVCVHQSSQVCLSDRCSVQFDQEAQMTCEQVIESSIRP